MLGFFSWRESRLSLSLFWWKKQVAFGLRTLLAESISGIGLYVWLCPSSLRTWSLFLLVGFTDPYNHTYSESLWWKLFKNHQRTQIQRQRQWQRQRQRQRHRKSAWNTHLMLYFWNPDDSLIPNMMIDTSPWSSCSRRSPWSPWSPCSSHTFSSTGPSVSPFRDFLISDLFFSDQFFLRSVFFSDQFFLRSVFFSDFFSKICFFSDLFFPQICRMLFELQQARGEDGGRVESLEVSTPSLAT